MRALSRINEQAGKFGKNLAKNLAESFAKNPGEKGMVTPFVAVAICVVIFLTGLVAQFSLSAAKIGQLQNTADLAALAGAQIVQNTGDAAAACQKVQELASAAECSCHIAEEKVVVALEADPPFLGWGRKITARAVAGPVAS